MKHSKEKIIEALTIIKAECEGVYCSECPFGDDELINETHCRLKRENPANWNITKEEKKWKALS